jgi:type II secretory pathway predicted ATPase ExeA
MSTRAPPPIPPLIDTQFANIHTQPSFDHKTSIPQRDASVNASLAQRQHWKKLLSYEESHLTMFPALAALARNTCEAAVGSGSACIKGGDHASQML